MISPYFYSNLSHFVFILNPPHYLAISPTKFYTLFILISYSPSPPSLLAISKEKIISISNPNSSTN